MVLLDFTKRNAKNEAVARQYGVRGFPTILFTDPEGKVVGNLRGRDPASVAKQFNELSDKYRPRFIWEASLDAALAAGKKDGRLVAVLFTDPKEDAAGAAAAEAAFDDAAIRALQKQVAGARHAIDEKCATCKKVQARPSTVVVLDPKAEDPLAAPLASLSGKRSGASLAAELKKLLKKGTPGAGAADSPADVDAQVEKECRMALLLARNFINQRAFDKAEAQIRKVLEKMPEGKMAEKAKALQREIEAAK